MVASSSTSSVQKSFTYDVFLSFRGEDTRKTFVDHLYQALRQKSIHTYKDDERIKKGKRISDELIKSIEDSKFYIIVFSKNYASSSWCLDELVKIMECHKMTEHTAYPVFYNVEPTEVRKQSGEFGKAFARQEKEEAAEKWREALKEAANLSGLELKNTADGHEAKFIQKIVEEISQELGSNNFNIDEKLIGMEARVRDAVSFLELGINDVRMIGIKGIGGGGKTTLARAVFDQISFQFEGSSFVQNVRENSNPNLSGLKNLQKQVLQDVLNERNIDVSNVYDGKRIMKRRLCCRKVLVVLDDVNHIDQLKALAGELNWFNEGSRIIITTRDEQVLVAHRVQVTFDVNLLSDDEAICLFSRYAFGGDSPIQGYEELSGQVVSYAAGLPLTITVLGSFLCGKNKLEWEDAIERLKTIPLKDTLEILELSYVGLEEDYKEIFLDVACMMKGLDKEEAIIMLECSGFHARNGLRVLEQKSLITISKYGYLDMHDHIKEMGKNIVRRLHPNEPNRHSRLWIKEEIEDILANNMGTDAITCIQLHWPELNSEIIMKGLGKMKNLRHLRVHLESNDSDWKFDEVSQYFPNALRYLYWGYYPFGSLPKTFQANNLVGFHMHYSKIVQLWEGGERKVLKKLRFFSLKCSWLKRLDLGLTPNLENLNLDTCVDLVELHIPSRCRLKLISLDINASKLRSLDLRGTPCLEILHLTRCNDLVKLHIPNECLLQLRCLHIDSSKLRTFNLRGTPYLETLSLKQCDYLEELHIPDECRLKLGSLDIDSSKLRALNLRGTPSLEMLRLTQCDYLEELHIPDECLLKLKSLDINSSKLRTLNLRGTPYLETLSLKQCDNLEELHIPIECPRLKSVNVASSKLRILDLQRAPNLEKLNLKECCDLVELHLHVECLKLESIEIIGANLRTFDLGWTPNLKKLNLSKCRHLVEVHARDGCLKKLNNIDLSDFVRFELFSFRKHFEPVEVGCISKLDLFAKSLDMCPLHFGNNLPKFQFIGSYVEHGSSLIGNVEKLISLGLCACTDLEHFSQTICGLRCLTKLTLEGIPESPKDLDRLECLEELHFLSTNITHLPDSVCLLKHLKCLELNRCRLLQKLPEDLDQLECLEKLILSECIFLPDVPNSISKMKRLEYLHLRYCDSLEKLPEELGCLECLKELNIEGTSIRHLPQSIFELKGLRIVASRCLLESCGFTSGIQTSEDETFCYVQL